jgi:hypothetical protein
MKRLEIPEIARRAAGRGRKGRGKKTVDVCMSGRFGDYVYYMRGGRQCCRRYVVPKDPRTPAQLRWRAALSAASRAWSNSGGLTELERQACRAAGAKMRGRPRMGQSGPLTGQLYYVKQTCGREEGGERRRKNAECRRTGNRSGAGQGRSPKSEVRVPNGPWCGEELHSRGTRIGKRSTWEQYRAATVIPPSHYRQGAERGRRKEECRMKNGGGAGGRGKGHLRELWRGS